MVIELLAPRPERAPRGAHRPAPLQWLGDDRLLDVREVASARRCSVATVWRDVRRGLLPSPLYLAPHRPRWRLRDVLPPNPTAAVG
jgi:predicted DNA-binding transcriptional regulator AlpA